MTTVQTPHEKAHNSNVKKLVIAAIIVLLALAATVAILAVQQRSHTGLKAAQSECKQYTVSHTGDKALDDHKYTTIKVTEDGSGLDANTRPSMSPKLTRCIADKTGMTDAVLKRIDLAGIDYDSIGEADWNSYHAEWQRIPVDGAPLRAAIVKLHIERG